MLEVERVAKRFGGYQVLRDCTIRVRRGEIVALIGPNGAGKTTLFEVITGSLKPDAGAVRLQGSDITARPPFEVVRHGLARTFQVPRPFARMTVIENLMVAAPGQRGETLRGLLGRPAPIRRQERLIERRAWEIIDFLRLRHLANERAGALSGGQLKLLELGRALMLDPKVLLLDEPVAGVNPTLARQIAEHIVTLRDRGVTFLIVEHNMDFVMGISDRVYVLAQGAVLAEGLPDEVRNDRRVMDAYLGMSAEVSS